TGNGVTISLARLEGNTNGGIWIATDVASSGLSITQPQTGSIIHSSTAVTGTGNAFEAVIGKVSILNHLYTTLGQATAHGATGNGNTTFSTNVTIKPSFKNGAEEGLVMLDETSNANGGIAGAVIVKVLIEQ
ncbi:MAG TPA: Gmad2 immunoglobulin-like domain-containing protein, partial [Ktedonobacteraceae bacterium]|nr:Gmad2 immunoglobulin-like domain-containing protein [Ktedonobacteraceae bacterium]